MTSKVNIKVLKGQDAENKVLDYIKRINRPYGAVDVSANLKGTVPKPATQKILLALAEKGEVTQKTYGMRIHPARIHTIMISIIARASGKATLFVANQNTLDALPEHTIKALADETDTLVESNKVLAGELKTASAGAANEHLKNTLTLLAAELAKMRLAPTDAELAAQIAQAESKVRASPLLPSSSHCTTVLRATHNKQIAKLRAHIEPLREGTPLVSAAELDTLDADWTRWRAEWVRRRKVFYNFWALVSDSLSPPDAEQLAEDLGIEYDTPEHVELERGPLCALANVSKRR
ncbi:TBPIP-domain-containing protein [Lactarius akahatsu]|uniref:TBPIP-domain-containing protein n=1 Tax=Lactarius akahatsu TaxID=416441 RepID=A0AAD4LJ94_9AGAM|nr:TBPIP-domain-containing protein [Lactarius akahatsu]